MDALTHSLVALTIGSAGHPRWGPRGAWLLVAAANLPELERLAALGGAARWVEWSYGAGHNVAVLPLLALAAAAAVHGRVGGWRRALELAALALLSHLALDLASGPGVRLLWPFSTQFYGWTLLARYDLLTLLALGAALMGPRLLNLVNSDIGARPYRLQGPARAGLAAVLLLLAARGAIRWEVDRLLGEFSTEGSALAPSVIHPWNWYLVRDLGPAYSIEEVSITSVGSSHRFRKIETNRALETAADTPLGRAFLAMARFPQYSLERGEKGMLVRIRDLRFFVPGGHGREYSVEIEVTPALKVVAERAQL